MFETFKMKWGKAKEASSQEVKQEIDEKTEAESLEKEQEEAIDPMSGMSLEEKLELMSEKKGEMEALQRQRIDFYVHAKNLEDKLNVLGLSEDMKKEIREKIKDDAGGISDKIQEIRDTYGFSPTPTEIYSERLKMFKAEEKRIKETLAWNSRQALVHIKKAIEAAEKVNDWHGMANQVAYHINEAKKYYPEVWDRLNSNFNNLQPQEALKELSDLKGFLERDIEDNCIYKTPGDIEKAEERLNRVRKIEGETESTLYDAARNGGRFTDSKDYF